MVNKNFVLGIMVLVFGLTVLGCDILKEEDPEEKNFVKYSENGHLYQIIDQKKSWTEAKKYCETKGGYLATIKDANEQAFIKDLLMKNGSKRVYWIGGYCSYDRIWKWVTNEPMNYTNWGPVSPNNYTGNENELYIIGQQYTWDGYPYNIGDWDDGDSNAANVDCGFIIERE